MKNLVLFITAAMLALVACDNGNSGNENDGDADNNILDQRDTSAIDGVFNSRGVPAEGIPDNNALRGDSMNVGGSMDDSQAMGNLPQAVSSKIMQDESLRNKKLTSTREFLEGGKTYYELTFDNEASTMTFDAQGNKHNR